ncbi:EAL domain-containing protein [Roseibium sp. Sym1]|uniref:EAL domain-containing protein n=1 Tax=Roseibium sp. Sym1 TaxID=3016006 RepID=UPI0022B455CA|nr:EAL domain-containing protein [Roseibium sp. Sym1]
MADDVDIMRSVFACAPSNITVFDNSGRILLANSALQARRDVNFEDVFEKFPDELSSPLNLSHLPEAIRQTAAQAEPRVLEIPYENAQGTAGIHIINLVPALSDTGHVKYVIGYSRNIADVAKLNAAVAEDQLHAAVKVLPDIFWIKDTEGRYVLCNEQFDLFNGIERGSMLGKRPSDLGSGPIYDLHKKTDEQALASKEPVRFELELPPDQENGIRHYEVQKTAILDSQGKISGLLGMARNVTERHKLEEELRTREREYRHLAEHLPDCLIRYDARANPVYMNAALLTLLKDRFGIEARELMEGKRGFPPNTAAFDSVHQTALKALESGQPQQIEESFQCLDGSTIVEEIRLFPEFDDTGETTSVVGIGRDITAKKIAERDLRAKERELRRLAFTDTLTGLANRATFTTTLAEQLERATSTGKKIALLTLDIDGLKSINDTLGHATGDALLQKMAKRLRKAAKTASWIGRLGGDEFALILSGLDAAECAEKLAEQIIELASQPMTLEGNRINVSMSVGITVGPDDSPSALTLFRYSDIALYAAKSQGRGHYRRYSEDLSRAINKRFEFEAMINEGLRSEQFVAYFQPKTNLASLQVRGAEALCRWRHPEKGFISPAEFIPLAEETGQILEIGRRVLKQTCQVAVECNKDRTDPFVIAVNVSSRQLLYGGFLNTLRDCLEETGCKASWLELEITESILLTDDEAIIETLETITGLGTMVSLDDFGTGYSALSYLLKFPISGLKIDQSFIREVDKGGKQEVLVRTILTMAQSLGLKTVAEGIETREIAAQLTELGCDEGQGYFWHRPMSADNLLELARQRNGARAGIAERSGTPRTAVRM